MSKLKGDTKVKPILRVEKPAAVIEAEEREQKLRAVVEKAKKPLIDKEKLDLIIEQNQIILEMLKPKGG